MHCSCAAEQAISHTKEKKMTCVVVCYTGDPQWRDHSSGIASFLNSSLELAAVWEGHMQENPRPTDNRNESCWSPSQQQTWFSTHVSESTLQLEPQAPTGQSWDDG